MAPGRRFPQGFRALVVRRQGMIPSPGWLRASFRHPRPFGPLPPVHAGEARRRSHTTEFAATAPHEDHPLTIAPIAESGNAWFTYDLGADPANQPAVLIDPEEPGDGPRTRTRVAEVLEALVVQMEPEPAS